MLKVFSYLYAFKIFVWSNCICKILNNVLLIITYLMFYFLFFILDLYWKFFDLIYIYIDVLGVEILATASDLLFYHYPLFYYIIVGVMLPKLIYFSTVVIFRGIKFIYVFWNAIKLFTKSN